MSESGTARIRVRYWAAAKAAAGLPEEYADGPVSLAALTTDLRGRHDSGFARVLDVCSVLVDGRQMKSADPDRVLVHPGSDVEFLPPFAGG